MLQIRENTIGRVCYDFFTSITYFTPVLLHNRMARAKTLLPLYECLNKKFPYLGKPKGKSVVFVVTAETTFNMGLADRLRGVTSAYNICKEMGVPFKLHFKVPNMIDYLEPNTYDWRIEERELCYDVKYVYPCTLLTFHANLNSKLQSFAHRQILKHYIRKPFEQIHIHTNMVASEKEYGQLFKELFKPTPLLQKQLDIHLPALGGEKSFIAMVYRFRRLFGDLKDGGEILPEEEREAYLRQAVSCVEREHGKWPDKKILVTSDSKTFINRIKELPYVYTLPGEVVHMGVTTDADRLTYLKSFLDYYMLSYAQTVISVRDKKMYHSGFALRAAMLNGAEYKEVWM